MGGLVNKYANVLFTLERLYQAMLFSSNTICLHVHAFESLLVQ